jgi:hypothetical protein
MLWWLACTGFILGILALFPCWGWVPGLIGIPFNLCSRYLAKADLAKMQAGLMDPSGKVVTALAMSLSNPGLGFNIAGTVVWGGVYLVLWWIKGSPWW